MNKKLTMFVALACAVSLSAFAEEETEELETESSEILSAGVDLDVFSAYVWRNAVQNDRLVAEPGVWVELEPCEMFSLGAFVWQNYDLTRRRRRAALEQGRETGTYKRGLTETDYNVHVGFTPWATEEEEYALNFELGHDWFTYQGVHKGFEYETRRANPDTREIYLKATFENPFIDVYGQASWMYRNFGDYRKALSYEAGLTKEIEVTDELTLGADWNVNFGDGRYMSFLYGTTWTGLVEDDAGDLEEVWDTNQSGVGGTTAKLYATWRLTENISLGATIAYTGIMNHKLRKSIKEQGRDYDFYGSKYPRDLLWGGLSLKVEF